MAFFEARCQGFSPDAPVSCPPTSVSGFSQENDAKINAISTLLNSIAEPSLHTKWQTTHCT